MEKYHVVSHEEGLRVNNIVAKVTPPSGFGTTRDDEFQQLWNEYSLVPNSASSIVHLDYTESTDSQKMTPSKHQPDPHSVPFEIEDAVHPISSSYNLMSQPPLGAITPASFESTAETMINARDGAQALLSERHHGFDITLDEKSFISSHSSFNNIPTPTYKGDDKESLGR